MAAVVDKHEAQPNVDEMTSEEGFDQSLDHENNSSAQDRTNSTHSSPR